MFLLGANGYRILSGGQTTGMGEDRQLSDAPVITAARSAVRPLRVGITGHTDLGPATGRLVAQALSDCLDTLRGSGSDLPGRPRPLVGVSCLAPGADCVFADVVLRLGGELEVILPSADYADSHVSEQYAPVFDSLLRRAGSVRFAGAKSGRRTFAAANDLMLESVDELIAVWNGTLAGGIGGTAHAVRVARSRGLPVTVIWPEGSRRG